MYHLHSYFDSSLSVDQPDCVYRMNSIHAGNDCCTNQQKMSTVLDPDVARLEERQEALLRRLAELEQEVDRLSQQCVTHDSPRAEDISSVPMNGLCDIVVSASPSCPPLSLLVLQQLLSSQYRVLSVCHVHSSVRQLDDTRRNVFGTTAVRDRRGYQFVFTLIWKEVECVPVMTVSPASQTSVHGEASIARHLARLLRPAYDSAGADVATRIDAWVDLARTLTDGNAKERLAVMRNLNGTLGRSDWLVGGQLGLADVAMWSAMQRSKQGGSATGNVKRWLDACNTNAAFQLALTLVE